MTQELKRKLKSTCSFFSGSGLQLPALTLPPSMRNLASKGNKAYTWYRHTGRQKTHTQISLTQDLVTNPSIGESDTKRSTIRWSWATKPQHKTQNAN